jgi:hypothetical protein
MQVLTHLRGTVPSGDLATDQELWKQLNIRLRNQLHVVVCTAAHDKSHRWSHRFLVRAGDAIFLHRVRFCCDTTSTVHDEPDSTARWHSGA